MRSTEDNFLLLSEHIFSTLLSAVTFFQPLCICDVCTTTGRDIVLFHVYMQ